MLSDYYQATQVRARLCDFLGGPVPDQSPTVYVTGEGKNPEVRFVPRTTSTLWSCLDEGLDVGRSLWDRVWLIAHLDFEYVNFDFPAEPYINPLRTFALQSPVVETASAILRGYGIQPLRLVSGRGHHLVWKIRRQAEACGRLAWAGRVTDSARHRYGLEQPPVGEIVGETLGAAYAGLGQVMEYLAQQILYRATPHCRIPITLTAVEVGPTQKGREAISIDISEYGDPLFTRAIRMPFSIYLKPEQQRYALGDSFVDRLPNLFLIPQHDLSDEQAVAVMRDHRSVAKLADNVSTTIPDCSGAMSGLIDDYEASELARFHDAFYDEEHDDPSRWPETYDRTPLESLPPCVQAILSRPNDVLMKPAAIQMVVRTLLAIGWCPRHIAGLIRSKYERDYGWGSMWYDNDASTRADFYVRMFSGLLHTGLDSLFDFNCVSTQEKGYCDASQCDGSLVHLRDALTRSCDERMACRHLDRVLL